MYDEKEFYSESDFKRYSIGSTTDGLKQMLMGQSTSISRTRISELTSSPIGGRPLQ